MGVTASCGKPARSRNNLKMADMASIMGKTIPEPIAAARTRYPIPLSFAGFLPAGRVVNMQYLRGYTNSSGRTRVACSINDLDR